MANGQSLVNRALRLIGQIPAGEDATPDESDDALEALNAMLETWRNKRLMCFAMQEQSLSLTSGDNSYTIGPAGDLNTTRPVAIEAAWVAVDGYDHPVRIIEDKEYALIPDKTQEGGYPEVANYKATMATGTLYVWPVQNTARTMKLLTRVPLSALTLAGTVSLPPGWEEAIASNLAIRLAPEYEASPSAEVREMARDSMASIKAVNHRPIKGDSGLTGLVGHRSANIITDD